MNTIYLDNAATSFPKPEGAFYVFPSIAEFAMGSEEFCLRLIREGKVAAVPGTCFGGEGHTTFTIAGPTGEGITSARSFTRQRRCVMADSFRII